MYFGARLRLDAVTRIWDDIADLRRVKRCSSEDQYGERSAAIGKRFGRLNHQRWLPLVMRRW
jgi:hypothetical protein